VYSQNKEEGVVGSLFGNKGRFLDCGAFDGRTFSNTLRLYERGWKGVLIEPSPAAFAGLQRQYNGSERAILVNAAIAKQSGQIDFFDAGGDAVSSTETAHKEKWEKGYGSKFTKIKVTALTWLDIFNMYGTDFDFVNLDTEGTNLELLREYPFIECTPACMCIEHDNKIPQMMEILRKHKYRIVYTSGENIVVWNGPR
jgi:FkbM family methyltransferase